MDKTTKGRERTRPPVYSNIGNGKREGRQRLSIELGPEAIDNIERLRQMHGEISNTQVIRLALAGHREALEKEHFGNSPSTGSRATAYGSPETVTLSLAKNRTAIIQHATVLIVALQEALDYDPVRHHNSAPPPLWVDSPAYLKDVNALAKELRRLNQILERNTKASGGSRIAREIGRQIQIFADNYIPLLARGTACITLVVMGDLLTKMGIGSAEVRGIIEMVLKAAGKG